MMISIKTRVLYSIDQREGTVADSVLLPNGQYMYKIGDGWFDDRYVSRN